MIICGTTTTKTIALNGKIFLNEMLNARSSSSPIESGRRSRIASKDMKNPNPSYQPAATAFLGAARRSSPRPCAAHRSRGRKCAGPHSPQHETARGDERRETASPDLRADRIAAASGGGRDARRHRGE